MNSEQIMKSDVLDIVFEKRNKLYGAYTLRKFYNNRLLKSIGLMLTLITFLCAFTFLPDKKINNGEEVYIVQDITTGKVDLTKPKLPEVKPKVAPALPAHTSAPVDKFVSNIKITNTDPTDKLPDDLDHSAIGNISKPGTPGSGLIVKDSGTGFQKPIDIPKTITDINTPLNVAEVMPSFPGGMAALRNFLQANLVNPTEMNEGEEVSVKVKFIVGYDGKLKSFSVAQSGGEVFDNEVIRVLKKMPQWNPGKSNGQNVSVYNTIPVKFMSAE